MDHIVPRWEWRTFGQTFGPAEARFAALTAEKLQSSAETYLVAAGSDANVKIRGQLIDIKILERVDSHGLEQWRPVLKEPFPLTGPAVAAVRAALGLNAEPSHTEKLSLEQLVATLALSQGSVHVVAVRKTRARYHVHDCVAELTQVVADGKSVRTVAIEDEDAAKVIAAVRAMGLDGFPNTSYPRGLVQLLGLASRGR